MRSHVSLLGILHLVWGGMGLLLAVSLLMLAFGAAAIARTASDAMAPGAAAILFVIFGGALAVAGWVNAWAGRAIRQHRAPGRIAALALAVLNVFVLPFGTALAIYGFWVLLHNDARALFEPAPLSGR